MIATSGVVEVTLTSRSHCVVLLLIRNTFIFVKRNIITPGHYRGEVQLASSSSSPRSSFIIAIGICTFDR